MESSDALRHRQTLQSAAATVSSRLALLFLQGLRLALYGVLVLLRPVVIPVLFWLSVGCALIWFVFVVLARDAHFPSFAVLGTSAACTGIIVLYYALMEFLMPGSLGQSR